MVKKLLALCVMLLAPVVALAGNPRIAVFSFETTNSPSIPDAGDVAASKLTLSLVKSGEWTVVSRDQVQAILKEQQFTNFSGLTDPSSAAAMGKVLGVEFLIMGRVNRADFGSKAVSVLGVSSATQTATIELAVQVIDVASAAIVGVAEGVGTDKASQASVGGLGGGGSSADNSIVQKAFDIAIDKLMEEMTSVRQKVAPGGKQVSPMMVAAVNGDSVTINAGSERKLEKNMTIEILGNAQEVRDPATGDLLATNYDVLAEIKLTDVQAKISTGVIKKKTADFYAGAPVRIKQ